jgi:hypothetical protein
MHKASCLSLLVNFHVFFVEYLLTQIHLTLLPWEAQMVSTTGGNLMKNLVSLAGILNRLSSARYFRPAVLHLINKKWRGVLHESSRPRRRISAIVWTRPNVGHLIITPTMLIAVV